MHIFLYGPLTAFWSYSLKPLENCWRIIFFFFFFNFQIFKNGELDYNEDEEEEEENNKVEYKQEKLERPKQFGQGFALPGFPASGFKLKPTGRSLLDNSPSETDSSAQQGKCTNKETKTRKALVWTVSVFLQKQL